MLWHDWSPGLNGIDNQDPWASSFGDLASFHVERCLGACPVDFDYCWAPPEYGDADDIALEMLDHLNVWDDGSRDNFSSVGGFEVAGVGAYLPASELAFDGLVWGTVEEYGDARCIAALLCQFLVFFSLSSVLSFGVPSLLCRPIGLAIWV